MLRVPASHTAWWMNKTNTETSLYYFPFIPLVISVLCALLFLSRTLITGSISKSRQQFNVTSVFSPVLWKKRHSISWHSIESDSSPWWWALPFLYVTSSEVLKVVLSRLVILPRRIIPQFQSPEQMNQISHVEIHSAKCVRVEHQVTSTYPLTLRSSSISHPLVSR